MGHPGIASVNEDLSAIRKLAASAESENKLPNACLKAAAGAVQLCRNDADSILAFLILPGQQEFSSGPLLRHILMLVVAGLDQQISDHTLQHLVAATILASVYGDTPSPSAQQALRRLTSLFRKRKFALWLDTLVLRKALAQKKSLPLLKRASLNRYQRLVLLSDTLAQLITQEPLSGVLRKLTLALPSLHHKELHSLQRLLGEYTPGARVLSQGVPAVILAVRGNHAAVVNTAEKTGESAEHEWVTLQSLGTSARSPLLFDSWLGFYKQCQPDQDANTSAGPFRREYPINRPPGSLLNIIDALQASDIDIDKLCELIEKEPVFTDFLRQSASSDNRLQLPVHNIKQAVLTYGTERVGDMLTQQALQSRLNQHHFPLGTTLRHFAVLVSSIAAQLSTFTDTRFTSQSASLVSTFLTAPLFMLPVMKTLSTLPLNPQSYHNLQQMVRVKGTENWQTLVSDLAQGWHQSATWRALLYHTGKLPSDVPRSLQKEYSLLCVAVFWAASWLFDTNDALSPLPMKIEQAMTILSLEPGLIESIRSETASLLYCPLDL